MTISIREIDHVVLRVSNVGRMLDFYCNVLGCKEERRLQELGLIQLRAGSSLIDLVDICLPLGQAGGAAAGKEGRNMDHFCVRVEPFDEFAIRSHLEKHGVKAGATETRYGAEGSGPSIYLQDPEGNVVELKGAPENTGK
jgi:catechol 2,3-dioxygenase-like lactoylglutathione lyase family enzyme